MANPIIQVFSCIWSVIVGSSRVILFLGCLILVVIEIIRMGDVSGFILQNFRLEGTAPASSSYNPFYNPASILIFACFGAVSAFFNHSSIKVFPIILFLCILSTSYEVKSEFDSERVTELDRQFGQRFNRSMIEYDWEHEHMSGSQAQSTEYVDKIQRLNCCGYNGPSDWDNLRPAIWPSDRYPVSCCFRNVSDYDNQSIKRGCTRELLLKEAGCHLWFESSRIVIMVFSVSHIIYLMVLTPIALLSQSTCSSDKASQKDRSYTGIAYN